MTLFDHVTLVARLLTRLYTTSRPTAVFNLHAEMVMEKFWKNVTTELGVTRLINNLTYV